ncbi:MAG: bifunctional glutamate N-acetyltransferase/amino-acid acetyltransferase ArgJ, partial [Nitrospirae bacterium]|nr:bifunctional glutamate N-acetyltransferase/amino-acid acetyltransferase ArgJ [Candidatus Troglogloeales bacterium]
KIKTGGSLTDVSGFTAAGISAGIKKNGRPDLALIFSQTPCAVAAVFTKNNCPASSILFNKARLRGKQGQAIICNSGNANAATGAHGMDDTKTMAEVTARCLGIPQNMVFVASTGVIGESLPIEKITKAIPILTTNLSENGGHAASEAMMTTDTFAKEIASAGRVGSKEVCVGGMAKGSGMIHPNMATMLAFLATDALIDPDLLQEALREASDRTFNCTTVDGETSTNDLVILLANGRAGGNPIRKVGAAYRQFVAVLEGVCLSLSKMIVKDGEGATKFIEVRVRGTKNNRSARDIAFSIAKSSLVKTAFFGQDANWGRIVAAIGNTKEKINLAKLDIAFGKTLLLRGGVYQGKAAESRVAAYLKGKEICLVVDLHNGLGLAVVFTSDLSYDYVKINAAYRS